METSKNDEDLFDELRKKYLQARNLLECHGEKGLSESGLALRRKNEAVNILKTMEIQLEDALKKDDSPKDKLNDMLGVILLDIGIVSIDNEDLKVGEEYLMRCTNVLANNETHPHKVLPSVSALNQLGLVWVQWSEPAKAEVFLKKAEQIYKEYKNSENGRPVPMAALFGIVDKEEPGPDEILDKLHTLTLYYLAQIYGATKDHSKSAEYCHMTLQRQLDHADLDHIDWALNAATLAQFFMEKHNFRHARHHLAAASYILQKYKKSLEEQPTEEVNDEVREANWERYRHRSADVARCWAKYGIALMNASRERLIERADNAGTDGQLESEPVSPDSSADNDLFFDETKFGGSKADLESITNRVTDEYLLDFNDARHVFLDVQNWLQEAQKYYNFESHASDYVQIIEDQSQAFKCLTFFEDDEERQAKMHKRRIDLLEPVVNELNPQYYQTECRQLWIELAETYSAILTIKLDKLRASESRPTPHVLNKINSLAQLAIKYYRMFLDSLKQSDDSTAPIKYSDEMVVPALYAYFHLGTLYNKIITPDKGAQLENVKKSFEAYKFFVNYCESNPELTASMKHEFTVCKELVDLLPLKINKLAQAALST